MAAHNRRMTTRVALVRAFVTTPQSFSAWVQAATIRSKPCDITRLRRIVGTIAEVASAVYRQSRADRVGFFKFVDDRSP